MIINLSKMCFLSRNPYYAIQWSDRMRGMIGRNFTDSLDAMVFSRCNMIHMMFMSIPLDVVFVNNENIICALYTEVSPWTPWLYCKKAIATIELQAGTLKKTGTELGDKIDLNSELTSDIVKKIETSENLGIVRPVSMQRGNE
ncbi:MAG: DUF192 domain-containing protein [Victivallaceae bacterium]|jgi:uncharacterized membrane protein (UPF0127 family)